MAAAAMRSGPGGPPGLLLQPGDSVEAAVAAAAAAAGRGVGQGEGMLVRKMEQTSFERGRASVATAKNDPRSPPPPPLILLLLF